MTEYAVVSTDVQDSGEAGRMLGGQIVKATQCVPDVVVLFAAPQYEHTVLLQALKETCQPKLLVGCSSAGEFTRSIYGSGLACALALRSDDMLFSAGLGRRLREDRFTAAVDATFAFQGKNHPEYPFQTALVLADTLPGYTDSLIEQLTHLTGGSYEFFGGGAGDNAAFRRTPVFYDTEVACDAVMVLEMLSKKPLGIGTQHGWRPASRRMQVTAVDGMRLISLDGMPAAEVFQAYAQETGQKLDANEPIAFFLHNLLGIETGGGFKLRAPLIINNDGSVTCAAEVPEQATVCIMTTSAQSAEQATEEAARTAYDRLYGAKPAVALFFDCVASRLRMGKDFTVELDALRRVVAPAEYVGCNTHGQIARSEGQFSGYHHCTPVVCLIPE